MFVRESERGREEMGIEGVQFHINIYSDIFENILGLINKVIVALRCFQFRRNSFLFFSAFFFLFSFFGPIISGSDKFTLAFGVSLEKLKSQISARRLFTLRVYAAGQTGLLQEGRSPFS